MGCKFEGQQGYVYLREMNIDGVREPRFGMKFKQNLVLKGLVRTLLRASHLTQAPALLRSDLLDEETIVS